MGKRKKTKKKFWDTKFGRGLKKAGSGFKEAAKDASEAFNLVVDFLLIKPILEPIYHYWEKHDHTVLPALKKAGAATKDWIYENRKYTYPILITAAVVVVVGTAGYGAYGAYTAAAEATTAAEAAVAAEGVASAAAQAAVDASVAATDAASAASQAVAAADAAALADAVAGVEVASAEASASAEAASAAAAEAAASADAATASQAAAAEAKAAAQAAADDATVANNAAALADSKKLETAMIAAGEVKADKAALHCDPGTHYVLATSSCVPDDNPDSQDLTDAIGAAFAPSCSTLLLPANGSNVPSVGKETFSWTSIGGVVGYYDLIFTLPSGNKTAFKTTHTSLDRYMEAFTDGGEYKWQIAAYGSKGNKICSSEVATFDKPVYERPKVGGGGGSSAGSGGGGGVCVPPAPCP